MAGAYCKFCDERCFVERKVPNSNWCGYRPLHMATCPGGMAHDREQTGYDQRTAINPHDEQPVNVDDVWEAATLGMTEHAMERLMQRLDQSQLDLLRFAANYVYEHSMREQQNRQVV